MVRAAHVDALHGDRKEDGGAFSEQRRRAGELTETAKSGGEAAKDMKEHLLLRAVLDDFGCVDVESLQSLIKKESRFSATTNPFLLMPPIETLHQSTQDSSADSETVLVVVEVALLRLERSQK